MKPKFVKLLKETEKVNLKRGVVRSGCHRFIDLEQDLWNSGQKIYRVLSLYDRFLFQSEEFT